VVGRLISPRQRPAFVQAILGEYDRIRAQHAGQTAKLRSIAEARARAPKLSYDDLPRPRFIGVRVLSSDVGAGGCPQHAERRGVDTEPYPISVASLVPFIDWSPFFHTWELRGRYPSILDHPRHGEEARKLLADAQTLLGEIVSRKLLRPRGVYGLFPANRVGDDVELYTDHSRTKVLTSFHFLRQQIDKPDGQPHYCLADFIAPKPGRESGLSSPEPGATGIELSELRQDRSADFSPPPALLSGPEGSGLKSPLLHSMAAEPGPAPLTLDPPSSALDYLGAFAVTSGHGLRDLVEKFKADHDDYLAIMAEALADRLAEAFAEFLHKRVREDWGYGANENLTTDDLLDEKYRGIRPAAGYPACPDHTEKGILWELLDVEKNAGIRITESFAMWPGSSVSGLYFAHPESKYFAVGKLGRDQLLDYHLRKGMTLQEVEKWLGPYLNYDPESGR